MGFIKRLLSFGKTKEKKKYESEEDYGVKVSPLPSENENIVKLRKLQSLIDSIMHHDSYIAKSDYKDKLQQYEKVVEFFTIMDENQMLSHFCETNGVTTNEVQKIMNQYTHIENIVDEHNETFLLTTMQREKEYLDTILKDVDPTVMLDDDQRRVVLTDEDYQLVIAGAGAGKTTTVAAKVKYLVEKKGIQPSQILVVSFTNKAVNELKDKI